jgi:uncharacterized damage-inducible protein DinB
MGDLKQTVNRMIQTSNARLFQCLSVLSDEEFFEEPAQGASVAWTVGHLINSSDYFVSRIYERPRLFEQYEKVFRGGRVLTFEDINSYPGRRDFETDFRNCHETTITSLNEFNISLWDENVQPLNVGDSTYFSRGMMWEFIARHTFYHLGQLSVTVPRLGNTATLLYPNLTLDK